MKARTLFRAHTEWSQGDDTREESLGLLADEAGVAYNTLARAAKAKRLVARKSGRVWLSTRAAVNDWLRTAVLKPRK